MNQATIGELGEFNLIRLMQEILGPCSERVIVGLGDDAATLPPSDSPQIVTADMMVEDVHFRLDWCSPADLAHKALASNLSDLAAKCARPEFYVISLGLPPRTSVLWVEKFYRTLVRLQDEWDIELVGGDTVRSDRVVISIAAWGSQTTSRPIRINNAQVGDILFVTGTMGDAAAGLELMQGGFERTCDAGSREFLLQRFHRPTPRLHEAWRLAEMALPTAMTDISDGLARDLPKLCAASGLGARIDPTRLPYSEALRCYAGEEAAVFAWRGGEDYELLLTIPSEQAERLLQQWDSSLCRLTPIGEMTSKEPGIVLLGWEGKDLAGFDHFLPQSSGS